LEEQAHGWFTNTSKSSEVSRRGQEEEGRGAGPSTSTGCLWVPRRRCSARLGSGVLRLCLAEDGVGLVSVSWH
jgi:hypothetical protein